MYSPTLYTTTWLDQFFDEFNRIPAKSTFRPVIDISEDNEAYILKAEIPGVSKENIKIEVKENQLTLSGKKEKYVESATSNYQYTESTHGSFSRSFELPIGVSHDSIDAKHDNGVLTLIIPKPKKEIPKTINIQ